MVDEFAQGAVLCRVAMKDEMDWNRRWTEAWEKADQSPLGEIFRDLIR
jgi:hypothetical protein